MCDSSEAPVSSLRVCVDLLSLELKQRGNKPCRCSLGVIVQSLKGGRASELTRESAAGPCRYSWVRGETRLAVPCFAIPFCALKASRAEKGILSNLFPSSWRDEILHSAKHMTEKCSACVCVGACVRKTEES